MVDKTGQNIHNIFPKSKQLAPTSKQLFPASEQLASNSKSDFKEVLGKLLEKGTQNFLKHQLGFYISPQKDASIGQDFALY